MSRILLVDDSPHAQRIGERILTDEGYEVVTVSNSDSALIRLEDADPDVVVVKSAMPGRNGFEICRFIKMSPRHRHVRVVLTAGAMDALDEAEVAQAGADGTLRKPFEATALLEQIRPLADLAAQEKAPPSSATAGPVAVAAPPRPVVARVTAPVIAVIDPEQVRAAVTVAVDSAMGALVDEITERVLAVLTARKQGDKVETRAVEPPKEVAASSVPAAVAAPAAEPVRQVTRPAASFTRNPGRPVFRPRSGSILGLNLSDPEQPQPNTDQTDAE
jgi:CheY-like chemotaxis protein